MLEDPARPLVAVLGGAKVADKIGVVERFLELADQLVIGGAMVFPFLSAQGHAIGASLCDAEDVEIAAAALADAAPGRLVLPVDLVVGGRVRRRREGAEHRRGRGPRRWMGLDIGPRSAARYAELVAGAATVFWNGPMGVFEMEPFAAGTRAVAEAVGATSATTVAGGGETVAAARRFGVAERIDHVSTGGGAALELIEGRELPGVSVLRR